MTAEARGGFEPAALRRWIPLAVAVAILGGVAAYMLARGLASPAPPEQPAPTADGFVRFRDVAAGLSISHPAGWRRVTSADPEVRLLAEGDDASMSVRTADIGIEVGPESLGAAKRLTDKLVSSVGQVKLARPPTQVTLGGLPGYLYLYSYPDAATGGRGAHAHYFLFRGRTLITIVFQTAPAERLAQFAPLFDRIGETLRPTPG
ncbi:MAG: hypothetical protein ACR2F4_04445 [Thermoleophilaceae bacterium]